MKNDNIRFIDKLQIIIVIMLSVSVGICGTSLIKFSFESSKNSIIEEVQNTHKLAMYILAVSAEKENFEISNLSSTLRILERQIGKKFKLTDEKGNILYQKKYNDKSFKKGLIENVSDNKLAWRIQKNVLGFHEIQVATAISRKENIFYLESIHTIEKIYQERNGMISRFLIIMFVIVILGVILARYFSILITRSLTELAKTARAIAKGDFSKRVYIRSNDEIGQLANDFNIMAQRVEENIIKLEKTMKKQEEFMAFFAHELRTPMTSIIGYADIMRSHNLTNDLRKKSLNYIFTEGKRLERLSNKLLDIIVLEKKQIERKECDIYNLVVHVCGLLENIMKKSNININLNCKQEIWFVEADLIKTLIINLIDNARKAMPKGGEIKIITQCKNNFYEIVVKDTGYGIPEAEIPRIKEAFYRVDKARSQSSGGVGLGLTICNKIAKLHSGRIYVESKKKFGTTISVYLKRS